MVFSSIEFIFRFLLIFLVVYYITPRRFRNIILLTGSLVFYAWGETKYFFLILVSIFINYLFTLLMVSSKKRKPYLILMLIFNMGMLFVFKYLNFFIDNINLIPGVNISNVDFGHLPLGISFYTFQIISYVVDVYRNKFPAEKNIISFATYITMFPQLTAGPIVYYSEVKDDLKKRRLRPSDIEAGVTTFIIGLAYKVLLADQIYTMWNSIQTAGVYGITTEVSWLGAWAYSFKIYFDFAGYSMMAIGLGRILGFCIPINFVDPYQSKTATEFWRRWHITLGRWFKEYIYFPLGGNRKGKKRMVLNLFVVWAFTGLWHGANWNFIIWGLGFFVILMIEKFYTYNFLNKSKIIGHLYMFIVIPVSWVVFALEDFDRLILYLKRMFFIPISGTVDIDKAQLWDKYFGDYWWLLLICAIAATEIPMRIVEKFYNSIIMKVLLIVLFWVCINFLLKSGGNPFLYFGF